MSNTDLDLAEFHLNNAARFADLSVRVWNFHIIGGMAVIGWIATLYASGELGQDSCLLPRYAPEGLAIIVALFLISTAANGYRLHSLADDAITAAKDITAHANPPSKLDMRYIKPIEFGFVFYAGLAMDILIIAGVWYLLSAGCDYTKKAPEEQALEQRYES